MPVRTALLHVVRRIGPTSTVLLNGAVSVLLSVATVWLALRLTGEADLMGPAELRLAYGLAAGIPAVVAPTVTWALVAMLGWADALAVELAERNAQLDAEIARRATLEGELRVLASTDQLTGLANRRGFFQQAAGRVGGGAVVMVDVDHFKDVNDRHGHAAGDDVLRQVGVVLREAAGHGDVVGRIGGEEFAVATTDDADAAAALGERVRCAVATRVTLDGRPAVTISVGVAGWAGELDAAVADADAALYAAKRTGRDRVTVHHG